MKDFWQFPNYVRSRIWEPDLNQLSTWHAFGIRAARTLWAVISDLNVGHLNLRAMSLVYTTILSIVPLLAVSFSVLKGFGVHEQLETAMMKSLLPLGEQGVVIGIRIIEFVDNVKAGVLGSLGLALLLYTAISLMQKIENAFNYIWHVPQIRPFTQRFSGYLSVIIVGPILVFSSLGISASLMNNTIVTTLTAIEPIGSLLHFASALIPIIMVIGAFTFIYVFMPNTRVRVLSAVTGAIIAGILWNFAGWAFAAFVVSSAQYTAIYSAFAALIFFMLWLYIAWLVLLVGASVAYYHQHPDRLTLYRGEPVMSPRMIERAGLAIMTVVANDFVLQQGQPTTNDLSRRTGLRGDTMNMLINLLAQEKFIIATADVLERWLPTRPAETIKITDVLHVLRTNGEQGSMTPAGLETSPSLDALFTTLETAQADAIEQRTLADLVVSAAPETQAAE
jgi:membrane protein